MPSYLPSLQTVPPDTHTRNNNNLDSPISTEGLSIEWSIEWGFVAGTIHSIIQLTRSDNKINIIVPTSAPPGLRQQKYNNRNTTEIRRQGMVHIGPRREHRDRALGQSMGRALRTEH